MSAAIAFGSSKAVGQDPAIQVPVERFGDGLSQDTEFRLKTLFPDLFEVISGLIDDAVESCLLRDTPTIAGALSRPLPVGMWKLVHSELFGGHARKLLQGGEPVHGLMSVSAIMAAGDTRMGAHAGYRQGSVEGDLLGPNLDVTGVGDAVNSRLVAFEQIK